jgi:hypothetical protein
VERYGLEPWEVTVGQDGITHFRFDEEEIGDEFDLVKLFVFLRVVLPERFLDKYRLRLEAMKYTAQTGFYQPGTGEFIKLE